ncbi:hypothetical protein BN1723_018158, partial [Verticillium longisporum]
GGAACQGGSQGTVEGLGPFAGRAGRGGRTRRVAGHARVVRQQGQGLPRRCGDGDGRQRQAQDPGDWQGHCSVDDDDERVQKVPHRLEERQASGRRAQDGRVRRGQVLGRRPVVPWTHPLQRPGQQGG